VTWPKLTILRTCKCDSHYENRSEVTLNPEYNPPKAFPIHCTNSGPLFKLASSTFKLIIPCKPMCAHTITKVFQVRRRQVLYTSEVVGALGKISGHGRAVSLS